MKDKSKFDAIGANMVAIGNGKPLFAKGFQNSIPMGEGNVFIDGESAVYKALQLKRMSVWEGMKNFLLSPKVVSLYKRLSPMYQGSNMSGDALQMGGVFVITPPPDEKIIYKFIESENPPDEFANVEAMLQACADYAKKNPAKAGNPAKAAQEAVEEAKR
jgi:hypothetical protein